MEQYLVKIHRREIIRLLESTKPVKKLQINLSTLAIENRKLYQSLNFAYDEQNVKWKKALSNVMTILIAENNVTPALDSVIKIEYWQHPGGVQWPDPNFLGKGMVM
jgi:hypothetical protein